MRTSVWFGIVASLMIFVAVGCGGGLTADNQKLGNDYVAALKKAKAETDMKKQMDIMNEITPLAEKVGKLTGDQKKLFDEKFGKTILDNAAPPTKPGK